MVNIWFNNKDIKNWKAVLHQQYKRELLTN